VILLEIGLWERIDNLDKGALINRPDPDPLTVATRLVKHATQRLGFYAGNRYKQVVLRCLSGDFERGTPDAAGDSNLRIEFMRQVVDVLSDCMAPLSSLSEMDT
jgi:hypothetical protein